MWQKEQDPWGLRDGVISTLPLTRGKILDKLSHPYSLIFLLRKWESQWWVSTGHMRITQGPSTVPGMWGAPESLLLLQAVHLLGRADATSIPLSVVHEPLSWPKGNSGAKFCKQGCLDFTWSNWHLFCDPATHFF